MFALLIGLILRISAAASPTYVPDSLVTEDNVYRYTFSDTELSERIMAELRRRGSQDDYEMDITEGDLYYNTGRFFIATRFYRDALEAKAVNRDQQKTMKLLHRLISCYDGMYDEQRKAETIEILMSKAKQSGDRGMESVALFQLGKSLHEQGEKSRGYAYMNDALEMMEHSAYDRKYDNLRADCNDLLIFYERDGRYEDALGILDKLKDYLESENGNEMDIDGLYVQERCKWLAHRAVVCSKLGMEKEADEAYAQFRQMGEAGLRYAYLAVPYLFDRHKYDEIVQMCRQREKAMMDAGDTVNLYMSSALKFYGMACKELGRQDEAASSFERLAILRDSLRIRELRSSSRELSYIYDMTEKETRILHQRWMLLALAGAVIALAIIGSVIGYNYHIIKKKNLALVANVKESMQYKKPLTSLSEDTPDSRLFEQVRSRIIEQKFFMDNTFSRKALMAEFNIPANKFAGLFRRFTGKTFSEYINDIKIEYVAELLLSGKYNDIEALLKDCPFISSSTLYRLFTKKYGMTPQKFLQNAKHIEASEPYGAYHQ